MEILDILISLLVLVILEIVLGIDNLIFLAILTEKLPKEQQKKARRLGLTFAWVTRLMLLASAVWLAKLSRPLFSIGEFSFSARDIFLFVGGLFLIAKATQEINYSMVGVQNEKVSSKPKTSVSLKAVVLQIGVMDIIFSLDSVLTAIGLTDRFFVMALAISLAIWVMIFASEPVSRFINEHPTLKMLALSFLILIGTLLVADSFSVHLPRGYIYFAMGFSLGVEILNLMAQARSKK